MDSRYTTGSPHLAGALQHRPAELPSDVLATSVLVDRHLGELVGPATHGNESNRTYDLAIVQGHENRAAWIEDLLPRMVEINEIGVLDLPILGDPVQVHSAERIGMLGSEVDDLDSHGLAPFVRLRHPVEERGLLGTTGPT